MVDGFSKGERIIIGGCSPFVRRIDLDFLSTGDVIGLNRWGAHRPCKYWIMLDTFGWHVFKYWIRKIDALRFMRRPNSTPDERKIPMDAADYWFENGPRGIVPTKWSGLLRYESSTALAAISLAIILGASEVVLYGVDFVGDSNIYGFNYRPGQWDAHREPINSLLQEFQEYVPIYKTHPDSWLDLPLMRI